MLKPGTKTMPTFRIAKAQLSLAERLASRRERYNCSRLMEAVRLVHGSTTDRPIDDNTLEGIAAAFKNRNWSVKPDEDLDDLPLLRHERNSLNPSDHVITDDMAEFRRLVDRLQQEITSHRYKDENDLLADYSRLKDEMIFSAAQKSLYLQKWLGREFWTREQASALFSGLDPDNTPHRKMQFIKNSEIAARYLKALRAFDDFAQSKGQSSSLSLKLLRRMAEEFGFDFPRKPAQRRNVPASEKTLRAATINSFVLLLARNHYAFDPATSNIDKVASSIVADLEILGTPLVHKTVANALRTAASWLRDTKNKSD